MCVCVCVCVCVCECVCVCVCACACACVCVCVCVCQGFLKHVCSLTSSCHCLHTCNVCHMMQMYAHSQALLAHQQQSLEEGEEGERANSGSTDTGSVYA